MVYFLWLYIIWINDLVIKCLNQNSRKPIEPKQDPCDHTLVFWKIISCNAYWGDVDNAYTHASDAAKKNYKQG
jgi:hypothetical protein